jgi:hypothetical protein
MFKALRIRRASARLTSSFPEITPDVARARAQRMVEEYPSARADRVAEYLVHVELMARFVEEALRVSLTEETR